MTIARQSSLDYVTEVPGRAGPIYLAHMRCSDSGAEPAKTTVANLIIRPVDAGQISAGPTFDNVVAHRRCGAEMPTPQQ